MPPSVVPFLGLGLGLYQTFQAGNMQRQAIEAANRPRLSPEQQARIRREGTSNITSNLANRGLADSSLLGGALGGLETGIAEATAAAGTQGDVSGILSQQALGLGQSGAGLLGNVAEMYMLKRLFGDTSQGMGGIPSVGGMPAGSPDYGEGFWGPGRPPSMLSISPWNPLFAPDTSLPQWPWYPS